MDSCGDTPKGWVAPFGHPRINACSRLPVAFRSVPRPSSPPGAKASTECPSLARDMPPDIDPGVSTMHRNHPQRSSTKKRSPTARQSLLIADHSCSAHNSRHLNVCLLAGGRPVKDNASGQTCEQVRPETHQNLIHPDKDRRLDLRHQRHRNSILRILRSRTVQCQSFSLLRDTLSPFRRPSRHHNPRSRTGGGGDRTRTDDPLLAKQVLSQLSYTPQSRIWQIQSLANEEHWWAREDLNLRPHAYQACALTS
jgi:hypothetical protein